MKIQQLKIENKEESINFAKSNYKKLIRFINKQDDIFSDDLHVFIFENFFREFRKLDIIKDYQYTEYLFTKYLNSKDDLFEKRLENVLKLFFSDDDIIQQKGFRYEAKLSVLEFYVLECMCLWPDISLDRYQIIHKEFKKLYLSSFSPFMNPRLYIMLHLYKKTSSVINFTEFKDILVEEFPKFTKVFGECSSIRIAMIFLNCFNNLFMIESGDKELQQLELCDILFEVENEDIEIFAAEIFYRSSKADYPEKRNLILKKMSKSTYSSVLLYYNYIIKDNFY